MSSTDVQTLAWPANARYSGLLLAGIGVITIGALYIQRLGIPAGSTGANTTFIPFSLVPILLGIAIIMMSGKMAISRSRLELWLICAGCLCVVSFFQLVPSGTLSFFYLLFMYTPLVLIVPDVSDDEYMYYLTPFQWAVVPIALLAIYQFATQSIADPIRDHFLKWTMTGFNTHPYLSPESFVLRSNGYFLREPSGMSQTCAIALLMEITYFKNPFRSAIYIGGLFAAASGSGLVMLGVFLFAYARRNHLMPHLVTTCIVGAIVVSAISDNPVIANLLGRTTEIQGPGSSAYIRFVAPFVQAAVQLRTFSDWIIGQGAGSSNPLRLVSQGWSADQLGGVIPQIKMLIEYGIFGAISFTVYLVVLFFVRTRSVVISIALFMAFVLLNSNLQDPVNLYLYYIITMLFPRPADQS